MRLYFPNSGSLQNFGGFARKQEPDDPTVFEFSVDERYVYVHPIALSMAAAAAQYVRDRGGEVRAEISPSDSTARYLSRMKLTDVMGVDLGVTQTEHAPEGRFIPITQIVNQRELNEFIIDMVPLLHAAPEEAGPIRYVITEMVRNVLEHAASSVGAMVCAQYYAQSNRLSLGIADMGMGIRASIGRFHRAPTDLDAIHLALTPGVTGATGRIGGNEQNAGAGLFFTKSIARTSHNFFVVYSGTAMFKLLPGPATKQPVLMADPSADRATRESDLPSWPGTCIGIDINVTPDADFAALLADVRTAYGLDVRERVRARYRKPRFV